MIDTAQGYPLSEPLVAEGIAQSGIPRKEIFIITKLHPRFFGYEPTRKAVEESLKNLRTDYIDLFLIHSKICDHWLLRCQEGVSRFCLRNRVHLTIRPRGRMDYESIAHEAVGRMDYLNS